MFTFLAMNIVIMFYAIKVGVGVGVSDTAQLSGNGTPFGNRL